MPLLNEFRLGADPEFVIINSAGLQQYRNPANRYSPWGIDHNGWVIEPHPKPDTSVRNMITNIRTAMNDFALVAPEGKWRAGAFVTAPQRTQTLGGHIHIDRPNYNSAQVSALDHLCESLERLDILPQNESASRRSLGSYGVWGDIRSEHGHFEYRTMASWLYSVRATKICLTGTKLAIIDPASVREALGSPAAISKAVLKKFFERFKNRDDDVDWLLSTGIMDKTISVSPDKDLREVWRVEPKEENPHWKQEVQQLRTQPEVTGVGGIFRYVLTDQRILLESGARLPLDVGVLGSRNMLVPSFVYRLSVNGVRHRFRIPERLRSQFSVISSVQEDRNTTLRTFIRDGGDAGDGLVFRDGLPFIPLGPSPMDAQSRWGETHMDAPSPSPWGEDDRW